MERVIEDGKPLLVVRVDSKIYATDGKRSHIVFDRSRGRWDGHLVTCKLH
jgi:nitrite reductase/ring-hydroxylating ferredoxin subunit